MQASDIFFLVSATLGGLALFIFGMGVMTDGLREAAGGRLRSILMLTTANRVAGIALGLVLGSLIHSSGASVMLVGFVNAGLMSLFQSIPVILGANVGTTISMQAISFSLGDYAFFIIASGFIVKLAAPVPRLKQLGLAILGFGLLFLGMNIMSGAIGPYRSTLAPLLECISADTWRGLLSGVLISTAITAVVQSSGATIGMCFALIQAGVFTSIDQTFPIVLGAHIGTCTTALLGSIGANIQARQCAFSHFAFNVFNVTLALVAKGFFLWLIPLTSDSVLRQTANMHSAVMLVSALLILPVTPQFAKAITMIARSKKPGPHPSFLDDALLKYPEKALDASIRELQRVARICARSLVISAETVFLNHNKRYQTVVKLNERVVDEVKLSMKEYLTKLTYRYLSRRQAILIQHVNSCMIHLERISDHIDALCDLSNWRRREKDAVLDRESLDMLFGLYSRALRVFRAVIGSLNPEHTEIQQMAEKILRQRDEYMSLSTKTKAEFTEKVARRIVNPLAGFYFSEYVTGLDRIVRHSRSIALVQQQPQFWIKRSKLERHAGKAPDSLRPVRVDPHDYLERLQSEEEDL